MYCLIKQRILTIQTASFATNNNGYRDIFLHRDLEIKRATPEQMRPKPDPNKTLVFGHEFTDHMLQIKWNSKDGWSRPLICPLEELKLHPAAKVFHYAAELFEGIKAHRHPNGEIAMFRPEQNLARMYRTAVRAALPTFPSGEVIKILNDLVKLDEDWVPQPPGSLYIRPTLIGIDPILGVATAQRALLYVIMCPVGHYYPTGFKPVTLYADPNYVRAFPGGVGCYKMGCNYAPTMMVSRLAQRNGCQQVMWLYGEKEWMTEAGTMNLLVYWKNENGGKCITGGVEEELLTAPLTDGIILPGIIRDSLLHLARDKFKIKVSEKYISMDQIRQAIKENRLYEMFGSGTACVVSPVERILYNNNKTKKLEELFIPTMIHKPNMMQMLYESIINIQYGKTKHPEWTVLVK